MRRVGCFGTCNGCNETDTWLMPFGRNGICRWLCAGCVSVRRTR